MGKSAWTETGSPLTIGNTTSTVDSSASSSLDYIANADKITLIQNYGAELATKTSLDTTAASLSCSTTAYDNAVAAVGTTLVNAGAPSNWATVWPDGTVFGPVVGIKTLLANAWAQVASTRTALQGTISNAQAAAARTAAIAAAATDATTKTNAAVLASQPHQVAWAYAAKPALPSSSYPSGYYAITTDNRTVQVNAAGTAWTDVLVATTGLFGQIVAGQMVLANIDNLIPNPNSEQPTPTGGWPSGAYEGRWIVSNNPYVGTMSRGVYVPSGTSYMGQDISPAIPCNPGDEFYIECYSMIWRGGWTTRVGSYFTDAYGNQISSTISVGSTGASSYTKISAANIAPSGAVYIRFFVDIIGGAQDCWGFWDNFYARRMNGGELTVDGSITANKLAVGVAIADIARVGTLTAQYIYFTDGFCLNTLEPKEAGSDATKNHVLSSSVQPSSALAINSATPQAVPGFGWTVTASGTSDVFNIYVNPQVSVNTWGSTTTLAMAIVVDGNSSSPVFSSSWQYYQDSGKLSSVSPSFVGTVTGLAAGTHTIKIYAWSGGGAFSILTQSIALCQRIY